jgi:uncharacterized membrane protein YraQ (UPF0718 family)
MNEVMSYIAELLTKTLAAVGLSLQHNGKILAFAILLAVILKTYVNSDKLSRLLFKRKRISIFASVAFGAFTPLCACGTMAVIIGMLTTTFPWGPIMAFLTSSPLMSPDGFVLISGVIGIRFAVALTIASLVIGISSGFITNVIEKRTKILVGQSRFADKEKAPSCGCGATTDITKPVLTQSCSCGSTAAEAVIPSLSQSCSCGAAAVAISPSISQGCSCSAAAELAPSLSQNCSCSAEDSKKDISFTSAVKYCCGKIVAAAEGAGGAIKSIFVKSKNYTTDIEIKPQRSYEKKDSSFITLIKKYKLDLFVRDLYSLGLKQILFFYTIFVAVGYMINYFVPSSIISMLFGAHAIYAVPLASLIGLPLYITTDSGIPIIQSMLQSGASEGAMLAFMITGSATSAWVVAGLATFLKKRAIMLYVAFVFVGGILSGYLLDLVNLFLK